MKLNPFPFWRRQYLARYEQYLESYPSEVARDYAGRSITGCAASNIASPLITLIAATGGVAIPKQLMAGLLAVFVMATFGWLMSYIKISDTLEEMWSAFCAQSAQEKARRRREMLLYVWGSVLILALSFGLLILRAIQGRA